MSTDHKIILFWLKRFLELTQITYIDISFDGCGDSGDWTIDEIKINDESRPIEEIDDMLEEGDFYILSNFNFDSTDIEKSLIRVTTIDRLADLLMNIFVHIDYCNNEGGHGEITIDRTKIVVTQVPREYDQKGSYDDHDDFDIIEGDPIEDEYIFADALLQENPS